MQATAYAKAAMQHPELRVYYEKMAARSKTPTSLYQMALTDHLRGNDLLQAKSFPAE